MLLNSYQSAPAELEPARARREALRRAALADAPRWGGDEVLIRALIGVEDPASFTEALAHVGRGFASPTLTGELPGTVTAEFHVKLRRPTPSDTALELRARVVESDESRARVEATLSARGEVTATCRGTFVAIEEGHPAFHRW